MITKLGSPIKTGKVNRPDSLRFLVLMHLVLLVWPGLASAEELTFKTDRLVTPPGERSMQVVLVHLDGNCGDQCAQWISAEGQITRRTSDDFSAVLDKIGRNKIPVFIHSRGGDVSAALEIGRMLRAHQLSVSVTHTLFEGCVPGRSQCNDSINDRGYVGRPTSRAAICASACAYILAGGVNRYVAPSSLVGIHDLKVTNQPLVVQHTTTRVDPSGAIVEQQQEFTSLPQTDLATLRRASGDQSHEIMDRGRHAISSYLADMGIGPELAELAASIRPTALHWMTRNDLSRTSLATQFTGGELLVGMPDELSDKAPAHEPRDP